MIRTVEALVDEHGNVRLLEAVHLVGSHRAFVMILDGESSHDHSESALLSENSLATDWNRPEEDEAWAFLQRAR